MMYAKTAKAVHRIHASECRCSTPGGRTSIGLGLGLGVGVGVGLGLGLELGLGLGLALGLGLGLGLGSGRAHLVRRRVAPRAPA